MHVSHMVLACIFSKIRDIVIKIGSSPFDPLMASPKSFLEAIYVFYIIKWNLNQAHKYFVPKAHKSCFKQKFITSYISMRKFEA